MNMTRYISAAMLLVLPVWFVTAQQTDDRLMREVRMYNPYQPTLSKAAKKSFFPDMTDSAVVTRAFTYTINAGPYTPLYNVSTIRPATMLPDPLPKLYKSYLNLGVGNYFTPLGELSIASERSRTGMIAFYARHYSSNGKLPLDNGKRIFAGYMDNEIAIYGKKFLQSAIAGGSVDFAQLTRYAYGYDTSYTWNPEKKDIRLQFIDARARAFISSMRADSGSLIYSFSVSYDHFRQSRDLWQHGLTVDADAGRSIRALGPSKAARRAGISDFYARLKASYSLIAPDNGISDRGRHIVNINPSLSKKSSEWSFRLGLAAVTETRYFAAMPADEYKTLFHVYPDISFSISIIPSFLRFNLGLDGNLKDNSAPETVYVNPFLLTNGSLFTLPYTNNQISARAGFSGSSVPATTYSLTASYTVFNDMPFFSNYVSDIVTFDNDIGNFFVPYISDGNLANVHGEVSSSITRTVSARLRADYYNYSLTAIDYPFNMPSWDGSLQLKYNLRDKILAGAALNATGSRRAAITSDITPNAMVVSRSVDLPAFGSLSLSGEYRYTKILSFWIKLNNISFNRYYEWAFYPSQKFMFMAGFSYSL